MTSSDDLRIPGFDLLEKLGEGGMGTVYKARQLTLDRLVAIKVLPKALSDHRDYVEHFKREARAEAVLKHPNIVQVHQAGISEGQHYLVMEYVNGYSVGSLLERKGILPEADGLWIAESIARALEYAWTKARIMHGDIKPDNILIDEDGTVKLSDFLALRMPERADRYHPFADSILGTPHYMSPEQVLGAADLDCRSDIYSLGLVLYHLLTNRLPFAGPEPDMTQRQLTGTLDDVSEINPRIGAPLAWLMEKMLVRDLAARPPSWTPVLDDIRRVAKGKPPEPPAPVAGSSAMKRSARRAASPPRTKSEMPPPPIPAVAASGPSPKPAAPPPKPRGAWAGFLLLALVGVLVYYLLPDSFRFWEEPAPRPAPEVLSAPREDAAIFEPAPAAPVEAIPAPAPEFTDAASEALNRELQRQRGQALVEYVQLMQEVMAYAKNRNLGAALAGIDRWREEHPQHEYRAAVDIERDRIQSLFGVLRLFKEKRLALRGLPIQVSDTVGGEVRDVDESSITLQRRLGAGEALMEMELGALPDREIERLLRAADPSSAARNLAIFLVSKGSVQRLPSLQKEMSKAGQDPGEVEDWTRDWRQATLNARALRAVDEVARLVEAGQWDRAATRLQEAWAYFGSSDVFEWAALETIQGLETRIQQRSADRAGSPARSAVTPPGAVAQPAEFAP
jgi:serine/threonine protein kinase